MTEKEIKLAAIEPLPPGEWVLPIKKEFELNGYQTVKLKSALLVWRDVKCFRNDIFYADGAYVSRLWLSKGRWALSAINRRIYFKDNCVTIDNRPEHIIVQNFRPQSSKPQKLLENISDVLNIIKVGLRKFEPIVVDIEEVSLVKNGNGNIFIGGISRQVSTSSFNSTYKELGFDYVPEDMEIILCSIGDTSLEVPVEFMNTLKKSLLDRGVNCSIKEIELQIIIKNVNNLKTTKRKPNENKCILFLMSSNKIPPDNNTLRLFDELEELNLPFRRAYMDDPFRFSIPSQLPSIISAAGGVPHRSPFHINSQPIWSVGLDMGHDTDGEYTKIALSLIGPDGTLIKAWVAKQCLDETIQSEVFRSLLENCLIELKSHTDYPQVVFLRDGRFFEKDEIYLLKLILGKHISIFEYRKNRNPDLFYLIKGKQFLINEPTAAKLPMANTIFISTIGSYDKMATHKTAKVTWKDGWNGLELSPSQIASFLIQSANSPGLGSQPKLLPSSIYWADGIASTDKHDLRFRGQPICKLY